ncbi:MAG: nucleotidyltransferase [Ileibacterium sp.]|nr:nucleotidyltransferase [Ileibacterium sp.]
MNQENKKTALAIMAAGLGSRYQGGIKQIAPVGPNGEIIIEYSVRDALEAGFNRVVLIIRKDIEDDFRQVLGSKLEKLCAQHNAELVYAFQELNDVPVEVPAGRSKPWGTGHAIICAKKALDVPFLVINADDYYGKTTYQQMHDFMMDEDEALGLAAFVMVNTLSDNGGVSRAVIRVNGDDVTKLDEKKGLVKTESGAKTGDEVYPLDTLVSMNMFALTPDFLEKLEQGFDGFLVNMEDELKDEYLLPSFVDECLAEGTVTVKAVPTSEKWLGVTFSEDLPAVQQAFVKLHEDGIY